MKGSMFVLGGVIGGIVGMTVSVFMFLLGVLCGARICMDSGERTKKKHKYEVVNPFQYDEKA